MLGRGGDLVSDLKNSLTDASTLGESLQRQFADGDRAARSTMTSLREESFALSAQLRDALIFAENLKSEGTARIGVLQRRVENLETDRIRLAAEIDFAQQTAAAGAEENARVQALGDELEESARRADENVSMLTAEIERLRAEVSGGRGELSGAVAIVSRLTSENERMREAGNELEDKLDAADANRSGLVLMLQAHEDQVRELQVALNNANELSLIAPTPPTPQLSLTLGEVSEESDMSLAHLTDRDTLIDEQRASIFTMQTTLAETQRRLGEQEATLEEAYAFRERSLAAQRDLAAQLSVAMGEMSALDDKSFAALANRDALIDEQRAAIFTLDTTLAAVQTRCGEQEEAHASSQMHTNALERDVERMGASLQAAERALQDATTRVDEEQTRGDSLETKLAAASSELESLRKLHVHLLRAGDTPAQSHSAQIWDYVNKLEAAEAAVMESQDEQMALRDEQMVLNEKLAQSGKDSEALLAAQNELALTRVQLDDLVRKFVSVEQAMGVERTQWAAERSGVRATLTKSEAAMEALPGVALGEVYALFAELSGADERVDELAESSEQFLQIFEASMARLDEQVHSYKQSAGQGAAAAAIGELQRETATRFMLTLLSRFDAHASQDELGGDLIEMMQTLEERVGVLVELAQQRVADIQTQLQAARTEHRAELIRAEEEREESREARAQQDIVNEASAGRRVAELSAQKDLLDMCDARVAAYMQEYSLLVENVQTADTLTQALDAVAQTSSALGLVNGDEVESGAQRVRVANWKRPKRPSDRPASLTSFEAGEIARVATRAPTRSGRAKRRFEKELRQGTDVQGGLRLATPSPNPPAPATRRKSARLAGRPVGSDEESSDRSPPDAKKRRVLINAD